MSHGFSDSGDTLDERLRIMEDRLKSMGKRLGKSVEEFYHQVEDLEHRFANETWIHKRHLSLRHANVDAWKAVSVRGQAQAWGTI